MWIIGPAAGAFVDRFVEIIYSIAEVIERARGFEVVEHPDQSSCAADRHIELAVAAPRNDVDEHELPDTCCRECPRRYCGGCLLGCQGDSKRVGIDRGLVFERELEDVAVQRSGVTIKRCVAAISRVAVCR